MKQFILFCVLGLAWQLNAGFLIISDGDLTVGGAVIVKDNKFHTNTKDLKSKGSIVILPLVTEERDSLYIIAKEDLNVDGKLNIEGNVTIFAKSFKNTEPISGKNVTIGKITQGEVENLVIPAIQGKFGKVLWQRGDFDGEFLLDLFKKN